MKRFLSFGSVSALAFVAGLCPAATAQTEVVGWGPYVFDSTWSHESFATISAGTFGTVACRGNGTAVAWGRNVEGVCLIPTLSPGVTFVDAKAGGVQIVALLSDGSALVWGSNFYGQCNLPSLPSGQSYLQVAAGYEHSVALRSDGAVIGWGRNLDGQCNTPSLPPAYCMLASPLGRITLSPSEATVPP